MLDLRRLLCLLQGFVPFMRGGRPRRRRCSGRFHGRHQSDPQRNEGHQGVFQALCGAGWRDRAACQLRHLPGTPINLSRVSRNLGKRLPQRHLRPGPVELRAAAVRRVLGEPDYLKKMADRRERVAAFSKRRHRLPGSGLFTAHALPQASALPDQISPHPFAIALSRIFTSNRRYGAVTLTNAGGVLMVV
jgi:hypothetical protein